MRVIAGSAKGHKLKTMSGTFSRPTSSRVKEAMFSIIQPFLQGGSALDLFAGSGALGIEALSRGAGFCDFVEHNKTAAGIISSNLEKTKLCSFNIYIKDAKRYLIECGSTYDLIFLDPPYNKNLCAESLKLICDRNLLSGGAIAVCETHSEESIITTLGVYKESTYGDTKLTFYENR